MSVGLRRLLIWGLMAAILAAGIFYALRPRPVAVDMAVVDVGLLQVTIDEERMVRGHRTDNTEQEIVAIQR